jgi:hypothetical protein
MRPIALVLVLFGAALCLACGVAGVASPPPAPGPSSTSNASNASAALAPSGAPAPAPTAPPGFVSASVLGVTPTPSGQMLAITDGRRTVPIMIGDAEAMIIDMRLRGEVYERPLTHDLLDSVVRELGGTVTMVQVDKLSSGVFMATVCVWDGRAEHRIDSRTSDAIAIALGNHVPIYVSTRVFDDAGM